VRKGVNLGRLGRVSVDPAEAREGVDTVDVHGARSTDTLSARASEGEGRVDLVLNSNQSVQNYTYHGTTSKSASDRGDGRSVSKLVRREEGKGEEGREGKASAPIGPVDDRSRS
jgi:hypothetical protein